MALRVETADKDDYWVQVNPNDDEGGVCSVVAASNDVFRRRLARNPHNPNWDRPAFGTDPDVQASPLHRTGTFIVPTEDPHEYWLYKPPERNELLRGVRAIIRPGERVSLIERVPPDQPIRVASPLIKIIQGGETVQILAGVREFEEKEIKFGRHFDADDFVVTKISSPSP